MSPQCFAKLFIIVSCFLCIKIAITPVVKIGWPSWRRRHVNASRHVAVCWEGGWSQHCSLAESRIWANVFLESFGCYGRLQRQRAERGWGEGFHTAQSAVQWERPPGPNPPDTSHTGSSPQCWTQIGAHDILERSLSRWQYHPSSSHLDFLSETRKVGYTSFQTRTVEMTLKIDQGQGALAMVWLYRRPRKLYMIKWCVTVVHDNSRLSKLVLIKSPYATSY